MNRAIITCAAFAILFGNLAQGGIIVQFNDGVDELVDGKRVDGIIVSGTTGKENEANGFTLQLPVLGDTADENYFATLNNFFDFGATETHVNRYWLDEPSGEGEGKISDIITFTTIEGSRNFIIGMLSVDTDAEPTSGLYGTIHHEIEDPDGNVIPIPPIGESGYASLQVTVFSDSTFEPPDLPEPSSLVLFSLGTLGLWAARRRAAAARGAEMLRMRSVGTNW